MAASRNPETTGVVPPRPVDSSAGSVRRRNLSPTGGPPRGDAHVEGPGLVKSAALPLLRARTRQLVQCSDYVWRELFVHADVMSEGARRDEPQGSVYYGSSSVLLPREQLRLENDDDLPLLHAAAERDPHARLRAVRIACLEAQFRVSVPMGPVRAALMIRHDARGLWFDVDVEADLLDELPAKQQAAGEAPGAAPASKLEVTPSRARRAVAAKARAKRCSPRPSTSKRPL